MSKKSVKAGSKQIESKKKESKDWPVVVYVWTIGLFIATWFIGAEAIFESRPHAIHWLVGLVNGVIGIPVGWLWYAGVGMCSSCFQIQVVFITD